MLSSQEFFLIAQSREGAKKIKTLRLRDFARLLRTSYKKTLRTLRLNQRHGTAVIIIIR